MKNGRYMIHDGFAWYKDSILHREEGPAIEWDDGTCAWYIQGKEYSEEDFNHWLEKKALNKKLNKLPQKSAAKKNKI